MDSPPVVLVQRYDTELHEAAATGKLAELQHLLRQKNVRHKIDEVDGRGYAPLHFASLHVLPDAVKLLLSAGATASLVTKNSKVQTPLHLALLFPGDRGLRDATVKHLVSAKANPWLVNAEGFSPFLIAVRLGDLPLMRFLAGDNGALDGEAGASSAISCIIRPDDLNRRLPSGETALHLAARGGHVELLRWLLEAGADDSIRANDGKLPTEVADGNAQCMELLIAHSRTRRGYRGVRDEGETLLAAAASNTSELRRLIEAGLDYMYRDSKGNTALHRAAEAGNVESLDLLNSIMLCGPSYLKANDPNTRGWTPLHYASKHNNVSLIYALLKADGDPSARVTLDSAGIQWLRVAVAAARVSDPALPEPRLKPGEGITSIDIASVCGHMSIADVLEEAAREIAVGKQGSSLLETPQNSDEPVAMVPASLPESGSTAATKMTFLTGAAAESLLPSSYFTAVRSRTPLPSARGGHPISEAIALAASHLNNDTPRSRNSPTGESAAVSRGADWDAVQVAAFLHGLDLAKYARPLIDRGFDSVRLLCQLTSEECEAVGMKLLHKRILLARIAQERRTLGLPETVNLTGSPPARLPLESASSQVTIGSADTSNLSLGSEIRPNFSPDLQYAHRALSDPESAPTGTGRPAGINRSPSAFYGSDTTSEWSADADLPPSAMIMNSPGAHIIAALNRVGGTDIYASLNARIPSPAGTSANSRVAGPDGPISDTMGPAQASTSGTAEWVSPVSPMEPSGATFNLEWQQKRMTFATIRPGMLVPDCCYVTMDSIPERFQPLVVDSRRLPFDHQKYLGSGYYSRVYESFLDGQAVAVKIILRAAYIELIESRRLGRSEGLRDVDNEVIGEMLQEVEIINRVCRHDNIVQFRGLLLDPLAIITELMPRGNLEEMLVLDHHPRYNRNNVPLVQLARMAIDAAAGIMFLHDQRVVHRDIAARNFLVTRDWRVKASDFGFSRLQAHGSFRHTTAATRGPAAWMAPESLATQEATPATDVFAFGTAMYEIFTGMQPWLGTAVETIKERVVINRERLPLPHELESGIKVLISACWQHNPSDRPTMAEIHNYLCDWAHHRFESGSITPSSGPHPAVAVPSRGNYVNLRGGELGTAGPAHVAPYAPQGSGTFLPEGMPYRNTDGPVSNNLAGPASDGPLDAVLPAMVTNLAAVLPESVRNFAESAVQSARRSLSRHFFEGGEPDDDAQVGRRKSLDELGNEEPAKISPLPNWLCVGNVRPSTEEKSRPLPAHSSLHHLNIRVHPAAVSPAPNGEGKELPISAPKSPAHITHDSRGESVGNSGVAMLVDHFLSLGGLRESSIPSTPTTTAPTSSPHTREESSTTESNEPGADPPQPVSEYLDQILSSLFQDDGMGDL